jgi:uncharacterized SAM-binding protein YcdF (DUF218 family)
MPKQRQSFLMMMVKLPIYLAAAWALGFGFYILTLPGSPADTPKSDAIIVLTGGAGRLEAGVRLLEARLAERMLISGVNPVVEPHELSALTGADDALFTCCVDLDRAAPDTAGNASESAQWVRKHGFSSVVLVTADYHMPRSLILFRSAMPDARIMAWSVTADWPLALLAKEYNKYLVTLVHHAFSGNRDTKRDTHD